MKKTRFIAYSLASILASIALLTGCSNIRTESNETPGTIRITINSPEARTIVSTDSTIASTNTNGYEILIYNDISVISTLLDPSNSTATLSVGTGVYTVLILAGYCSSAEGILLGAGSETGVTVEPDTITDVSIALTSISHSFEVPEAVTCIENYEISVTGNTNNQLLQISYGGTTMDNQPYIEIGENTANIYLDCSVTDSAWTGIISLTAPALPELTNIKFFGSNIKIVDLEYLIDDDLENIGSLNWKWLNYSGIPEAIISEINQNIEFVEAETGINIIIGWI